MQVLKFGGTSVGSSGNIQLVKEILFKKSKKGPITVVVSAFQGITNQLLQCAQLAAQANPEYRSLLQEIESRHLATADELLNAQRSASAFEKLQQLLKELADLLKGVALLRDLSPQTADRISCYGELLSAHIISAYLAESALTTGLLDPVQFIRTDDQHGKANVDFEQTEQLIADYFQEAEALNVCPGFIAGNADGRITTLGRGGSDYTAAIIAAALNCESLEIWTDVSGMMTANPQYVGSAYPIEKMSYEEAMELTHFGAKVLYPPAIQPVLKKQIPIWIKNTFRTEEMGTQIYAQTEENPKPVTGLSSIEQIVLLNLHGSSMVGIPYFSHRLFEALSQAKVSVILITQASSEHSICLAIHEEDLKAAELAIAGAFAYELKLGMINPLEVERELAIIALVGAQMKNHIGISGKMLSLLGGNGVNIKAIAQGSSEKNISVVIDKKQLKKSLNVLHESFFLSEKKRVNLFIVGVGNVGQALLDQVAKQYEYLDKKHHFDLRIIAMANSKKMYFDEEGIERAAPMQALEKAGEKMEIQAFIDKMVQMNLRNSIFIDNTAHEEIAQTYQQILSQSISVVTPNKIACTGSMVQYKQLKSTALRYKSHFHFETNVGAGLPVINTLNDLMKSGDEVLGIEAVLSGSLNFIFNHYTGSDRSFAEIIQQAKEEGYTEPDPRLDLSGSDVKRKILILLRESGFSYEMEQIESVPFIPANCMEAPSVDIFLDRVAQQESYFQQMVAEAKDKNCKLKYVASYKDGKAETGLKMISPDSPLYNLEGKDNIVLFSTQRYPDQPLVIKGAGAGAAVTASGIFGDIMRIANTF